MLRAKLQQITAFSWVRFGLVGGVLFVIDASLLYLLTNWVNYSPVVARLVSASCSVTVSWWLHRCYTFRSVDARVGSEYRRFVIMTIIGFIINLSSYMLLINNWHLCFEYPVLALMLATAISMNFSYFAMKHKVFLSKYSENNSSSNSNNSINNNIN